MYTFLITGVYIIKFAKLYQIIYQKDQFLNTK